MAICDILILARTIFSLVRANFNLQSHLFLFTTGSGRTIRPEKLELDVLPLNSDNSNNRGKQEIVRIIRSPIYQTLTRNTPVFLSVTVGGYKNE